VASALKPGQRGEDLELLFRRTVLHNRMVLAWARRQPELDRERWACVGISMGGMVATALLAVEPQLRAGALCLAGGDLAGMVLVSSEHRVASWRRWRQVSDGATGLVLQDELRRELVSDPARLGSYIPTEKVLMVGGSLDSVVPPAHQHLLWESLGRPDWRSLPLGHYTAALAFGSVVASVDAFFGERFREAPAAALAQESGGR
jgi:dienelactone hydrolase